jgi:hypothetical protein
LIVLLAQTLHGEQAQRILSLSSTLTGSSKVFSGGVMKVAVVNGATLISVKNHKKSASKSNSSTNSMTTSSTSDH